MPVKVWIGEEYEYSHEARAVSTFIGNMKRLFDSSEATIHILVNFLVNGNPLDAAVVKSEAFIVIEFKDADGVVTGAENGTWRVKTPKGELLDLRGGKHGNPYMQAKNYRFAFFEMLQTHTNVFLSKRAEEIPFHKYVAAVVAFNPTLNPESKIKIGTNAKWFAYRGVDKLHEEVAQRRAPGLNLSNKEMERLIKQVFFLEEARMVENTPMRPLPTVKAKPTEIETEKVEPTIEALITPVEKITEPKTKEPEKVTVTPAESAPVITQRCIICTLGAEKCTEPRLVGRLMEIDRSGREVALIIDIEKRGPVRISIDPNQNNEINAELLFLEKRIKSNIKTTIACLHINQTELGYTTNKASILLLEPDWLINVTDLTEIAYCSRRLLVKRYAADTTSEVAILGNALHQGFREIWRGLDLKACRSAIESAVKSQALQLVVTSTIPQDVIDASEIHLDRLHKFAAAQGRRSTFRSETFVLAPLLGLKGRIDAVWEQNGKPVIVGELKTGRSDSGKPRIEHTLQVSAYAFMLIARGEAEPGELKVILLYSGDPENIMHRVDLNLWWFRKVMNSRNLLVRMEVTSDAPFETNTNKCFPCSAQLPCRHIGLLSEHSDPRPISHIRAMLPAGDPDVSDEDKRLFEHFKEKLATEFAAAKAIHANLWQKNPEERAKNGKAIALDFNSPPLGQKDPYEGSYTYILTTRSNEKNTSEIRPGDSVILSGEQGPMHGRTAIATVTDSGPDGLEVRMQEELLFCPAWADTYTDESLSERMFSGLYRFTNAQPELKSLLFESKMSPTFKRQYEADDRDSWQEGLNSKQKECIEQSLRSDHFLLIIGPPGSGKTTLIARMVQAHLEEGNRVLIATTTNRALDQALSKISRVVHHDEWLRLGSSLSATTDELRKNTISELVRTIGLSAAQNSLMNRPIVGGTISTLLRSSFIEAIGDFDVVIIDEATQSTIPATLGTISFGKRFVLIGDPKQLPPIVQSTNKSMETSSYRFEQDVLPGLNVSLFEYLDKRFSGSKTSVTIALEEQYRMNDVICSIPSKMWYEPELKLRPANIKNGKGIEIGAARLNCNEGWNKQELNVLLDPNRPFLFVDVKMDKIAERTNISEAELVVQLIESISKITDRIISPFDDNSSATNNVSLAVISPYRAQVARIRGMLVEKKPDQVKLWNDMVDTVDRFQGSEADFVIISLSPWTEIVSEHIADARRMNVSLTRARHKLIVMGNRSHLKNSPLFEELFSTCDNLMGKDAWYLPDPRR